MQIILINGGCTRLKTSMSLTKRSSVIRFSNPIGESDNAFGAGYNISEFYTVWCMVALWCRHSVGDACPMSIAWYSVLCVAWYSTCGMVLCVVLGVVLSAWHGTLYGTWCGTLHVAWYSVLCVVWYSARGRVLCVVRGVVRHLGQRQNPNELHLLTHTNGKVWRFNWFEKKSIIVFMNDEIKASEMLVAPRISECFGLGLL